MELLDIARKFSTDPSTCSADEVATLAQQFNLQHPQASDLLPVGNAHPGGWDALQAAIARAHFERSNLEALSQNPFASPQEIEALPRPSELAELSQSELGQMIFGA